MLTRTVVHEGDVAASVHGVTAVSQSFSLRCVRQLWGQLEAVNTWRLSANVFMQSALLIGWFAISLPTAFGLDEPQIPTTVSDSPIAAAEPLASRPDGNQDGGTDTRNGSRSREASPVEATARLVDEALADITRRKLTLSLHEPRQVMQSIAGLGLDHRARIDASHKADMAYRDWLASGVKVGNGPVWIVTPIGGRVGSDGRRRLFERVPQNFLADLAAANAPSETRLGAYEGQGSELKTITVQDVVRDAQHSLVRNQETTWTLWGLAHYLSTEDSWKTAAGEECTIAKLVELTQLFSDAERVDGGNHRRMALAVAVHKYVAEHPGTAISEWPEVWRSAHADLSHHVRLLRAHQLPDGSLHRTWKSEPEAVADQWYGAALELRWLLVFLPREQVHEQWITNAVGGIARNVLATRNEARDVTSFYTTAHVLRLYRQR